MPGELARRQAALVDHLQASGVLTRPEVAAAFRAVPRHLFLPDLPADEVYRDEAIPTKMEAGRAISSSSQPAIMAIMLEQLNLSAGQRVLEIGAGTGYNAALLGRLAGAGGRVVTVDIDDDIVAAAQAHLAAAGSANVQVICADGVDGYPPAAPYDRIILTAGAWDIAPAWYNQLTPGGRLVLPLRLASGPQESVAFDKTQPGVEPRFISQSARDCGFMPLRGAFAGPEVITALGPLPGLSLATPGEPPAGADLVFEWLSAPAEKRRTGLRTSEPEAFGSLSIWLGLHTASLAALTAEGELAQRGVLPCLFQFTGSRPICSSLGLLAAGGLALLDRAADGSTRWQPESGEHELFELAMVGYGPQKEQAAQHLLDLLASWDFAGRPSSSRLRLRVYRPDFPYQLAPGEVLVQKRWTQLVVDWPAEPPISA
jgi:protein-L-isoaspartate(D-aspartate) O-methyltransferase